MEVQFGQRVKVKREEKGMTQVDLAKASDLTQATISRIESGEVTQVRSENLKKLSQALGVTIDFLVGKSLKMGIEETIAANPTAHAIFRGLESLPEDKKEEVQNYVNYLISEYKKRSKGEKRS